MPNVDIDLELLEQQLEGLPSPEQKVTNETLPDAQETKQEETREEVLELSPIESLAKSHGWKPDGERNAEEFIQFALDNFSPRGKEIKELKATVDAMKSHMDKQKQLGYEQALGDLQRARQDAIIDGNIDEVNTLDQQIDQYEHALAEEAPRQEFHPAALEFMERHAEWMNDKDSLEAFEMRTFVQQRDTALAALYPNDPEKHIQVLEKNLKEKFKGYFGKSEPNYYPSGDSDHTSGTARTRSSNKKLGLQDLNPAQRMIAKQFEKRGVMTTDKYIQQLKDLGEL